MDPRVLRHDLKSKRGDAHRVAAAARLLGGACWLLAACGGGGVPFVDPRPVGDGGGLADRARLEAGTRAAGDAGAGTDDASPSGDGASATSGDAGPSSPSTVVDVVVARPADAELQVGSQRFTPVISVALSAIPPATGDDVKAVDVELWTTAPLPATQISVTRLSLLQKSAPPGALPMDAGSAGTAAGSSAAVDGGAAGATFTFGDTPIDLSALGTGTYELRVAASTLTGAAGAASRRFRIDAGPVIRVIAPLADQAARGSMFASVEVTDPFSDLPPAVAFSVAGLAVSPIARTSSSYEATILETLSSPPLSGAQLLEVRATDAAGVSAHPVVVRFLFDDVGPTITNAVPATGSLIGGIVALQADIDDPAGVDPASVVAVVAHGDEQLTVSLDRDPSHPAHFAHLFDTRRLSASVLYPTISFRASDLPGNQSSIGYTVAVDNAPPLADLDPPASLRARKKIDDLWRCSWPFDPLGSDAVNEGDLVHQVFDVRARVEDQGNTPAYGGADVTPIAQLDPAHVELLVLDDTSRALLVDTDGDGICDQLNPNLAPTTTPMSSDDALLVNLAPVPPTGAADFTPDPALAAGLPDCVAGTDPRPPLALCRTTDLSIALSSPGNDDPEVWTPPRVVPATPACVGNQLDSLGNHLADGPACLAVRAADKLGNVQVSRVLHVCIDHDGTASACPFQPIAGLAGGPRSESPRWRPTACRPEIASCSAAPPRCMGRTDCGQSRSMGRRHSCSRARARRPRPRRPSPFTRVATCPGARARTAPDGRPRVRRRWSTTRSPVARGMPSPTSSTSTSTDTARPRRGRRGAARTAWQED